MVLVGGAGGDRWLDGGVRYLDRVGKIRYLKGARVLEWREEYGNSR